jgi:Family of unknown function (DUF6069)
MTDPEYPRPYEGYAASGSRPPAGPPGAERWTVDAGRLWAGGAATALVAALVSIVGLLVARVFDVETLRPLEGSGFETPAARYAIAAAAAALVATGLMHLLVLSTPKPQSFFTWIVLLATAVAALLPFLRDASRETQLATALINVAIGICIGSLVSSVAARSIHLR